MTKARDLANLGNTATTLATTSQVTAAVAAIDLNPLVVEDVMDSK